MFDPDQYQLIDFGGGRRLERFGSWRLDRPCPVAEGVERGSPQAWPDADARFERTGENEGQWSAHRELPETWTIAHGPLALELKQTPAGHLGVFPEQAANWDWIAQQLRAADRPMTILNLFGYTGGSTLIAAAAGAEAVHVDAARNTVAWARRNAELSGMVDLPIRWIAEDATKFVKRELRRGNRYDAVVLDPPSYGHGARGEVWRLSRHLPRLLELCGQLTAGRRQFMLLTCHTPGYDPKRVREMMADAMGETDRGSVEARPLAICSVAGREMPSGVVARWTSRPVE
ncbi:MAG: class I SAM-dependent methyltransferase [Pirellulales bacterium]|nr:class I SAM-dependent methyltransferase [Pirellulales bacterium]